MRILRSFLAVALGFSLCFVSNPLLAGGKPLGILALAYGTHLNASEAFAGLSVFAGELMTTEDEGKAVVRIGGSVMTLAERSSATLEENGDGAHVDLLRGAAFFSSVPKNPLEAHVEDALLLPHSKQNTQAQVLIVSAKVLQVTARTGSLDFSYHGEFRVLPEGQTYRIYLESAAEPQGSADAEAGNAGGAGTQPPGMSKGTKVAYFIVAAAGAGAVAWGIHDVIQSNNGMESPAKP